MVRTKLGLGGWRLVLVLILVLIALLRMLASVTLVPSRDPGGGNSPGYDAAGPATEPGTGNAKASRESNAPLSFAGIPLFPGRQRDQIPTVDRPVFASEPANSAALSAGDLVVGVELGGIARAYPLWILSRCEIVNDRFGPQPVCVTYCPLSASAVVFDSRVGDQVFAFGNEGSLYECNLVMYDRERGSLWYQLRGLAIAGPRIGQSLRKLPATLTRWKAWRIRHPTSSILVGDEVVGRFFRTGDGPSVSPEAHAEAPFAPVSRTDACLPAMRPVLGFQSPNGDYCFTEDLIRALSEGRYEIAGPARACLRVTEDREVRIEGPGGAELPVIPAFWFAWHAAFPAGGVVSNLVPIQTNRAR